MVKKFISWLLAIIVIVVAAIGGIQHAETVNAPKRVVKSTVHLVAIGDSLTYGQGDQEKNGGYVGLIKPKLEHHYRNHVKTVNYGVVGDRSDQIHHRINTQPAIRRHLRRADVITMTVGGNDLMQTLEKVVFLSSTKQSQSEINRAGVTYRHRLRSLLTAIRRQNKHAPIFVISIYDPVYTYFPTAKLITNSMTNWDRITKSTLHSYGPAYFVNIDHLLSYGQYNTATKREQLVKSAARTNSKTASQRTVIRILNHRDRNLNQYISPDDNFHPNHRGYEKMAEKLYQAMIKHNQWVYARR